MWCCLQVAAASAVCVSGIFFIIAVAHLICSNERFREIAFYGGTSVTGNCGNNLDIGSAENARMIDVNSVANECYDIHAFEKIHYIRLA